MARRWIFLLVGLGWSMGVWAAPASREPANLDAFKEEIRGYVDSGSYREDIAAVATEATAWLERRAAQGGQRLTVIFDLDETLISNWSHMKEMDFAYLPGPWTAWVHSARGPAIEPVQAVYRLARRLGIEVIFITGRPSATASARRKISGPSAAATMPRCGASRTGRRKRRGNSRPPRGRGWKARGG
jgi:hypothetical protein